MTLSLCTFIGHDPKTVFHGLRFGSWCDRCRTRSISIGEVGGKNGLYKTLCFGGKAWFHWSPIYHWLYGWRACAARQVGTWIWGYECDWRERCFWSGARAYGAVHSLIRRVRVAYFEWRVRGLILDYEPTPTEALASFKYVRELAEAIEAGYLCIRDGQIDAP